MKAAATARANIALVKYWGKADGGPLNIPAVGSISITLDALRSDTEVRFDGSLAADELTLNGQRRAERLDRVRRCIDLLRARAGVDRAARVTSRNNFPTGAGLASSASGYAALTAGGRAGLEPGADAAGAEHRRAPRGRGRRPGPFSADSWEMRAGTRPDGSDSYAEPLMAAGEMAAGTGRRG